MSNPTNVEVGEVVKVGDPEHPQGLMHARAACSTDNSTSGHWFCGTCGRGFAHNWAMWSSTCYKQHRIGWMCHEHGPEVP